MKWIKKIVNSFPPQNFEGNWYYWLMNQWGHTTMTYFACIVFGLLSKYAWIVLLVFWFIWELRHYVMTKDNLDFIEDLYFEWSGIGLFLLGNNWTAYVGGLIYITSLITLAIKKRIRWQ